MLVAWGVAMSENLGESRGSAVSRAAGWGVGLWLGLAGVCLSGCEGSIEDSGASGGATGTGGATASGGSSVGGLGQSGGAPSGGGVGNGGASPSGGGGALGGEGGAGGAGGAGLCGLPFEGGPCDAAIPVYYHNSETGRCEPQIYGGCGGNANRFETYAECEAACEVESTGAACEIEGRVYPDGYTGMPDPFSCNTCSCDDGEVAACTKVGCEEECPLGTSPGQDCASCGPVDECLVVRSSCLPECDDDPQCDARSCIDGLCRNVCG